MRVPTIGIIILMTVTVVVPAHAGGTAEGFLVPGVDFSRLTFREGAWCRYVVADEALGQVDSTDVYIGVAGSEATPRGTAYWIEIESRLRGVEERELMKLLVLDDIRRFSDGDSLGQYVLELYTQTGSNPLQKEDPAEYEDFSLVLPTTDSSWVTTDGVTVDVGAGAFSCTKKERSLEDTQEVPTGKIKLIKRSRDDFSVWFTDEIPIFRMAKCVIERYRETETVPRVTGIPVSGAKDSRTTAELVAFGFDAKPILPSR